MTKFVFMIKFVCYFIFLNILISESFAQISVKRDTSVDIFESNLKYKSPWIGGMNSVQFNEIDLNLDGIKDLITFDRSGNKLNPYIKKNNEYIFAPDYRKNFPRIKDWCLTADYNCDGKLDLFIYSSAGIAVYLNTSSSSLEFTLMTDLLLSNYGSSNLNIYVSPVDIPAITDIDNDGDLDILTFSIFGGFIEYHKNLSIEQNGNCDSLLFNFEDACWGDCYEGINSYVLNCTNCLCSPITNQNFRQPHAGSTILAIDIDNDNDKDLIIGDILHNNLNLLINGGDNQNSLITYVDSIFPKNYINTSQVDLPMFPAAFFLDLNNDNVKDLVVSPNSTTLSGTENKQSSWLYTNSGSNNLLDLNLETKDFLQSEMVDLGEGAYPFFFDYNSDGLMDLVVGNYGYHNTSNDPTSSLALFENIGTNLNPTFNLIDRNWQNISSINLNINLVKPALNLHPCFGDLDGDNDKDMILGDASGKLHFFENDGNIPASFSLISANYFQIDVGNYATPFVYDLNNDGLNDLLVGEQTGTINYFPNRGTNNLAVFDTIIENFGNIDIEDTVISTGYSSPKILEINSKKYLISGSFTGTIYSYEIESIDSTFKQVYIGLNDLWDGSITSTDFTDLNNDSQNDFIIGNKSGGLTYYSSDSLITNTNIFIQKDFELYPNPTKKNITVTSNTTGNIKLYNTQGKLILKKFKSSESLTISLKRLTNGVYYLKFNNQSRLLIKI
tara:strand:+ start:3370 stop:5550 length:2181 start_codon:yes stop_codon:yes gene_type:complete